jgi:hypothetical protein
VDVSRHILVIGTSVLAKSNMDRSEYYFLRFWDVINTAYTCSPLLSDVLICLGDYYLLRNRHITTDVLICLGDDHYLLYIMSLIALNCNYVKLKFHPSYWGCLSISYNFSLLALSSSS